MTAAEDDGWEMSKSSHAYICTGTRPLCPHTFSPLCLSLSSPVSLPLQPCRYLPCLYISSCHVTREHICVLSYAENIKGNKNANPIKIVDYIVGTVATLSVSSLPLYLIFPCDQGTYLCLIICWKRKWNKNANPLKSFYSKTSETSYLYR